MSTDAVQTSQGPFLKLMLGRYEEPNVLDILTCISYREVRVAVVWGQWGRDAIAV
jgi:hypothetical protein